MKTHINIKDLPKNYTIKDWVKADRPYVWEILKEERIPINKNNCIELIIAGDQGYEKFRIFLFKQDSICFDSGIISNDFPIYLDDYEITIDTSGLSGSVSIYKCIATMNLWDN
jgi:hypothetical protein